MKQALIIILLVWAQPAYASNFTTPSQNKTFNLNSNLVANPNISTPVIKPLYFLDTPTYQSGWKTKGIYVEYIDACLASRLNAYICPTFAGVTCGWQFIDTDSLSSNQKYYQTFNVSAVTQFQLQFDWMSEISALLSSTGFRIWWNGAIIDTIYDNTCHLKTSTYYLNSTIGVNQLVFEGMGLPDCYGILIRNIKLQQLLYVTPSNLTSNESINLTVITFQNLNLVFNGSQYQPLLRVFDLIRTFQLTKFTNTFSTLKQNVKCIVGLILEFNHLLLYNYHLTNYTPMSNIILAGVNALDDQKGYVIDTVIYPLLGTSPEGITQDFQLQNNLPTNINNYIPSFGKYQERPNGIILEFTDMVFLDLPIMLLIFSVGYLAFRLMFRYRLSVVFRQYSILGCFFYMFWEGKIEVLTFYFLSDLLLLVNAHFQQKVKTALILAVYFSVFVFAVGGMLLLKSSYTRLLKYIYDNCKNPEQSSFHVTFEFGLFNLILGFTHRILINSPLPQLYLLIVIETAYLTYLTVYLLRRSYENIVLGIILWSMNCARLFFIVTFLVYELSPELESEISVVQEYFFYSFLILWGLSSFFSLLEKLTLIFKIIIRQCKDYRKKNKVCPQSRMDDDLKSEDLQCKVNRPNFKKSQTQRKFKVTVYPVNNEQQPKIISLSKGGLRIRRKDLFLNLEINNINAGSTKAETIRKGKTNKFVISSMEN